jgi:hypothetical protein
MKLIVTLALGVMTVLATIGGGGYWLAAELIKKADAVVVTTKADKSDLIIVAAKAEVSLNEHVRYLSAEISLLESKFKAGKATEYDKEQLRFLRDKLSSLQKIQAQ